MSDSRFHLAVERQGSSYGIRYTPKAKSTGSPAEVRGQVLAPPQGGRGGLSLSSSVTVPLPWPRQGLLFSMLINVAPISQDTGFHVTSSQNMTANY